MYALIIWISSATGWPELITATQVVDHAQCEVVLSTLDDSQPVPPGYTERVSCAPLAQVEANLSAFNCSMLEHHAPNTVYDCLKPLSTRD